MPHAVRTLVALAVRDEGAVIPVRHLDAHALAARLGREVRARGCRLRRGERGGEQEGDPEFSEQYRGYARRAARLAQWAL